MSEIAVQASFNSGEWAPQLFARVDLEKYHSGAALLQNFFVDYRGGASTRTGTKYILQAYKSSTAVRLIPFQATFNVGYVLEFGDHYIRFFFNGSPILENGFNITGATKANPCVITASGNNFSNGDWVYISNVGGMTQLNGQYFQVSVSGASVTLKDLNGNNIDSSAYTAYTSGGTVQRVYTLTSPYAAADLFQIKYTQNVNQMILCHPAYPTQVLTLVTAISWTITPITIGSTISPPTGVAIQSTLANGGTYYSYVVTAIDSGGQESEASTPGSLSKKADIRSNAGTNAVTWNPVTGAKGYNVYESNVSYFGLVPTGMSYGFIGYTTGTSFIDSNIGPNFSQTPPIAQNPFNVTYPNPFSGAGIASITITNPGVITGTVPTISFTGASAGTPAVAHAVGQVQGTPTVGSAGNTYAVGDTVTFSNGVILVVAAISGGTATGPVTAFQPANYALGSPGSINSGGTIPTNPVAQVSTSGSGTGVTANLSWGVGLGVVDSAGANYTATPNVNFSSGTATAYATLQSTSRGYASVPAFFQERLVLAAPAGAPQTFFMSQTGNYFNFDVSNPTRADDAITGTLVSAVLNSIKSIVSSTAGMLILTDKASWLVNGGSSGSAVTPSSIVASAQSFVGANDLPPIVANYDVLYVQSKGSAVRDLTFNIYFNVFTGTDISIMSSHLFYGYQIIDWCWAEQPFHIVWAVRSDGTLLSLTFLKEQEFMGWAHHTTTNGSFKSVACVTESTSIAGNVDATYAVVQRVINGNTVQYIERFAERVFPGGVADAWCVDAALQYVGSPTSTFSGAQQLAGQVVTGLADGVIIPQFTMPVSGTFTLSTPASKVTIGLPYICKLQTLPLDAGQPSIQSKVKKIPFVDIRVTDTLGLSIGSSFNTLVTMKDLVVGNVSSMLTGLPSQIVTGLVSGDARTTLDSTYTVLGQYCIQQSNPFPATVLGVFPAFVIGDDR